MEIHTQIIVLREKGYSLQQIHKRLKVYVRTVHQALEVKEKKNGQNVTRKQSGHPKRATSF